MEVPRSCLQQVRSGASPALHWDGSSDAAAAGGGSDGTGAVHTSDSAAISAGARRAPDVTTPTACAGCASSVHSAPDTSCTCDSHIRQLAHVHSTHLLHDVVKNISFGKKHVLKHDFILEL